MPAKPRKSNEDQPAVIVLRLPGKYKNRLIEHAERVGVPYTSWCVETLVRAMDAEQGLPEPPRASAGIPTQLESLHAYLNGERLLLPCGREGDSCAGTLSPDRLGSSLYCPECRIRVG